VQVETFSDSYRAQNNTTTAFGHFWSRTRPQTLILTMYTTPFNDAKHFEHQARLILTTSYRPNLLPHPLFAPGASGSMNSKADILTFAFSTSLLLVLGVFGSSSILVRPFVNLRDLRTSFGNVLRRGVSAVATFLADFRIVARISQERFFAKYQSVAVVIPTIITPTTTTDMAIIAPVDKVMDSLSDPDAPASVSPPASFGFPSPGASPLPGCCGLALARAAKKLATEADDIAGVKDTKVEVVDEGISVIVDEAAVVAVGVMVCPFTNVLIKKRKPRTQNGGRILVPFILGGQDLVDR